MVDFSTTLYKQYSMELPRALLDQSSKNGREKEFPCSNIKKISYILGNGNTKKIPYIFGKQNFLALILGISHIFSKESFSYILGNETFFIFQEKENPKKFIIFSGNKYFLIFQKKETVIFLFKGMELSSSKIK